MIEFIHRTTAMSFAITLHDRRHVVGQRVVSDISVVRSCWSIFAFVLNLIILLCYYACSVHCCTWNVYIASHRGLPNCLDLYTTWRRVYLVNLVTLSICGTKKQIVTNAVVTCQIKLCRYYFNIRRRPSEIISFQRVETCLAVTH